MYKQAIAVVERRGVPTVGPSVDRGATEHLVQRYNDRRIRSLVCFCCAQVKADTGGCRSEIEFKSGRWLLSMPGKALWNNFAKAEFDARYCQSGTALAPRQTARDTSDIAGPDFSAWQVRLDAAVVEEVLQESEAHGGRGAESEASVSVLQY